MVLLATEKVHIVKNYFQSFVRDIWNLSLTKAAVDFHELFHKKTPNNVKMISFVEKLRRVFSF